MENDWRDELTSCIGEHKKEKMEFTENINKVIQELSPSKYGVRAKFDQGSSFEIEARLSLNFAGVGNIEFTIKKSDIFMESVSESGETLQVKPSTPEEYQTAIKQLIVDNVKIKLNK
ncbi:hypothetical protein PAECIP112173_00328 [Paenibacillus sp. JJ-100]|uniref:hypothetical protein n=1 Tax=Paenibacillus sp. JJ-100 TaxID=2974896 RepID=UPI0022FF69C5|nr:hypothetical protein [Paenibacillus sp. JJ-100]CAI6023061.1 hypothetical protein PAECIP112173_00328 [Paenibacillus sp. JJ-100]